jgi:hypothetical protein
MQPSESIDIDLCKNTHLIYKLPSYIAKSHSRKYTRRISELVLLEK